MARLLDTNLLIQFNPYISYRTQYIAQCECKCRPQTRVQTESCILQESTKPTGKTTSSQLALYPQFPCHFSPQHCRWISITVVPAFAEIPQAPWGSQSPPPVQASKTNLAIVSNFNSTTENCYIYTCIIYVMYTVNHQKTWHFIFDYNFG